MARDLCEYSAEVLDEESENEWLYGRAGYLYLLRLVKASFTDAPEILQLITDTQEDVIDAIPRLPAALEMARQGVTSGRSTARSGSLRRSSSRTRRSTPGSWRWSWRCC